MYNFGLNIALRIRFALVKSCVKNIQRFKQAVSQCKMTEAGYHSISKLRAQIFNRVLADRGVKMVVLLIASQESEFESGLPQA
jgi:hypothetical protein